MSSFISDENQRDKFLSIVSHELKTPITSIQGFTQAMQRKIQQKLVNYKDNTLFTREELERHNENLETIMRQIKRMTRLVDDLLDISVIEKGTFTYTYSTVDIKKTLADVIDRIQEHSEKHTFRIQTAITSPCMVLGDESKLDQLFSNVISNALKFSLASDIVVVSIEETENTYQISVQDSGIGIPEEDLPHVFDLYYRGKDVGSRKMSGLGLGLYLSKKIVDSHRGNITVESRVNVGTTVTIILPKYKEEI